MTTKLLPGTQVIYVPKGKDTLEGFSNDGPRPGVVVSSEGRDGARVRFWRLRDGQPAPQEEWGTRLISWADIVVCDSVPEGWIKKEGGDETVAVNIPKKRSAEKWPIQIQARR